MEEQKEKKLFYIQIFDNFFNTEDMFSLKDMCLDEDLDPNNAFIIYLKLMLLSLANNGLISCTVVSPQIIKNKICYESNLSRKEDVETIEKVILILEKLGLLVITDNAIYMTKAIQYTLTKQEDSERRRLERFRNASKIEKCQLKAMNALSSEELERLEFEKTIDQVIYDLVYCGFISFEEKSKYISVLYDLDNFTNTELINASRIFARRSLETDYSKIEHKEQYLVKTLTNIIENEIRTDLEEFDSTFNLLLSKGLISKFSETRQIKAIIPYFVNKGFSNKEINEALISIINKITPTKNDNIISLASYLEKELERKLIKEQEVK